LTHPDSPIYEHFSCGRGKISKVVINFEPNYLPLTPNSLSPPYYKYFIKLALKSQDIEARGLSAPLFSGGWGKIYKVGIKFASPYPL
jgi:hypothetical protein